MLKPIHDAAAVQSRFSKRSSSRALASAARPSLELLEHRVMMAAQTESPFLGSPSAVPGTIMADNFDNGGQGVAYNDTTPGNQGGSYRSTDVDIEPATDAVPPGLTASSPGVGFDVGHIVASEWMNYTVNVATAGTYAFDVRIASGGAGGTFHIASDGVNVSGSMSLNNTGGWQTWKTVTANNISLTAGQHVFGIVFDTSYGGEMGNVEYINVRSLTTAPPSTGSPFLGSPSVVPGTIMADNFDNGGQNVAFFDTTTGNQGGSYRSTDVDIEPSTDSTPAGLTSSSPGVGFDVGHIQATEWMNYTINVTASESYTFAVRVASAVSGGIFHIAIDGVNVTGPMSLANTGGWQTWKTVTSNNVSLTAGQHVMTLMFDSTTASETGNVGYIVVQPVAAPPPPTETSFFSSPPSLPGTIMLDNFDNGGEGVAYNDTTPGNQGGAYRNTDVDIESSSDTVPPGMAASSPGVGFDIGHIASGEWLNFTVDVATAGTYVIDTRVATAVSGGTFHFEFDGVNVTGSMSMPNTGGWQTWSTVTSNSFTLSAGQHVMRLAIDGNLSYEIGNMGWMDLRSTSTSPLSTVTANWTSVTPSPVAREEGQSLNLGNLIYAFGGYDDPAFDLTTRCDVYNITTNTWTQLADMPATINHAGMIYDSVANTIWMIGGYTNDEEAVAINQVWIYSIANNSWSAGPSMPYGVGAPAVVLVGRNIHVISGLTETDTDTFIDTTEHWVMSLDNQAAGWTNAAPMPDPRNHAGYVALNGLIYVIGGQNGTDEYQGNSADVDVYNPATDSWSSLASLPEGRSHIMNSTLIYNGQILVVGGEIDGTDFSPDVLVYDPVANTWTKLTNLALPQGRKTPIASIFGNQLVVVGGQNPNPDADGWTTII
jgi:N-acetylneuraminic acid mutarotase